MYHLRSILNRRNVFSKPEKGVNACEDFFLLVLDAHICVAAMKVFKMNSLEDEPSSDLFPDDCAALTPEQRWKVMSLAIEKLISDFVDISYPTDLVTKDGNDHVLEYAKELLSLGLLLMEFTDSIHEGDGERILRCWRFFLPLFKACGRSNYAIEAFNLLFQYEYVFTPRMKQQLLWDRTVNIHGRQGKNVPMDLHMEHINRACKEAMGNVGSSIGDSTVECIGRSIHGLMDIGKRFDQENDVPQLSGKRSRRSVAADMEKLIPQLSESKVYHQISGREHSKFMKFQANPTRKLSIKNLKEWLTANAKKYEMFYV